MTRRYWECRTCFRIGEGGVPVRYVYRCDDGKCDRCGKGGLYLGKITLRSGKWPKR